MKKGILLIGSGDSKWIGGLYYIKNVAFILSQNKKINEKYNIYILSNKNTINFFSDLPKNIKIKKGYNNKLLCLFKLVVLKLFYNIKYTYPNLSKKFDKMFINISWIPDFQSIKMPEMFSKENVVERNIRYTNISSSGNPLVLSSYDSLNIYRDTYGDSKKNVYVLHFVSFIDAYSLDDSYCKNVLRKYDLLKKKYIYIGNQFWKHKNHIIVLKAIKLIINDGYTNFKFVFTGNMLDNRNPKYVLEIKEMFDDDKLSEFVINLGFIERKEQLAIMKESEFLIQPSLFEGWGTVVEDAKVLDKTIVLSDITVHREQKNEKCILFDPFDEKDLKDKIIFEMKNEHNSNLENGISKMYNDANTYSLEFEKLLNDCEEKK